MAFWIMAAGAAQGCFLAALLAGKARRGATSSLILSLLVALISLRLAEVALATRWGHGFIPNAAQVTFPLIFAFPPLLFFYVESLGRAGFRLRLRDWVHGLPFFVFTAWVVIALASGRFLGLAARLESLLIDLPWLIQACVYSAFILLRHPAAVSRIRESDASPERADIGWIRFLTWTFLGIGLLVAVRLVGLLAGFRLGPEPRVILYAAISFLIYLWGYRGLSQPEVLFPPPAAPLPGQKPDAAVDAGRISSLRAKVTAFMEAEKPYLDADLSLHGLAARLDEPPYLLSQMINRELNLNFFTFVNHYRVKEAKKRLVAPGSERLKLLALALESGFASKSSFNRVFKDLTGATPSEFQRQLKKSNR